MAQSKRRILVTGGGSGIGLSVARAFADAGFDAAIAGRNELKLKNAGLPYLVMDVRDEAAIALALSRFGPVDVFVANAGGVTTGPALKMPRKDWDEMIALNLTSLFSCAQAAIPPMIERGWGRFIVIASTASFKAYPYAGAYVAAKHGALGWVRALAVELAKTGVTANAICPGYTDTELISGAVETIAKKTGRSHESAASIFTRSNPMGRLINPEEVAHAAVWLAGEHSDSINGQSIVIDGGELIS